MPDYGQREVFERAAQIVASGWCQGAEARGRTNRPCGIDSSRAVKFCAVAAIDKAAQDTSHFGGEWFVRKACDRLGMSAIRWNDAWGRTQYEVVAFLRSLAAEPVSTDGREH